MFTPIPPAIPYTTDPHTDGYLSQTAHTQPVMALMNKVFGAKIIATAGARNGPYTPYLCGWVRVEGDEIYMAIY